MAKLSLPEILSAASSYVVANSVSYASYTVTRNNIVGLLDKIGKIFTEDGNYQDKLAMFDGEDLLYGKDIESWFADLIMPVDYDSTGSTALSPHYQTFRPAFYSKTLGRKSIPQTIPNNNIERAVNNQAQFIEIVQILTKRIYDSYAVWRYACKRQLLAILISLCETEMSSTTTFSASTAYSVNDLLRDADTATAYGIVVKAYTADDADDWDDAVEQGYIVELDLISTLDQPSDTETGEAFIKQVKKDVEIANDISEGHSLNGATIGVAPNGLVLLVKQGVMPEIEVDVLAGAFHEQNVAIPAEVVKVKDFGDNSTGVYAILMDTRGMRLHNTYKAVRENQNGEGDFLNMYFHHEDTGYLSRNTFVKIYKSA